ncbi:MAG TPA: phosphodiester glycosidase family protein [Nocardioides sp.]|nr:phosphodiester glycosidase family protein [Nocardioides sp.]
MRIFPALLVTSALAAVTTLAVVVVDPPSEPEDPPAAEQAGTQRVRPDPDDPSTWQTSDRVPGEIARPLPEGARRTIAKDRRLRFTAAPGVTVTGWDEKTPRGPVRYYVVRAAWEERGVSVDYAHGGKVKKTAPVSELVRRTPDAVAGINGDFFDIGDTGAPIGLGVDRGTGIWKGNENGWTQAFYFGKEGTPHIKSIGLDVTIRERPELPVLLLNNPQVRHGAIGVYTRRWGLASGYQWTDGQKKDVRIAHVVDGVVVSNGKAGFPSGSKIEGQYLVARGPWASEQLAKLKVGSKAHLEWSMPNDHPMGITGNMIVLKKNRVLTSDDGEMHPRTAVGIDRDRKQVIFLVVEGRQSFSRGYTMEEVALKLRALGAEDGINFDGGGSTTLVAQRKHGLKVINSPSDGQQRYVPNGLEVIYNKPQ